MRDLNRNIKRLVYKPASVDPLADELTFTYKLEDEYGLKSSNAATVKVSVKETADIIDSDGDLLSDADEENIFHTNPNDPDFDNDGIFDGEEVMDGVDPTNPFQGDYYADPLPYSTCFGTNQGYGVGITLDRQKGWKQEQGTCTVEYKPNLCWVTGYDYWGHFVKHYVGGIIAHLGCNSLISKEFEDKGADDENSNIIRVKLYPSENAEVLICCGDTVIAGAKFSADNHIWYRSQSTGDPAYTQTATTWSGWFDPPSEEDIPEYNKGNHSYAKMLKFKLDFSGNKNYEIWWEDTQDSYDNPVQVGGTGASFALLGNIDHITHVKFKSGGTEFKVRGLFINESDEESGLDNLIEFPCHCEEISKSRVTVIGKTGSTDISMHELRWQLSDYSDSGTWRQFWQSDGPVNAHGVLGYWNTGALPNGLYDIAQARYSELYYQDGPDYQPLPYDNPIFDEDKVYGDSSVIEDIAVSGPFKTTFHYVEEPDITVPWPGLFPFELRRIYDGSRRFFWWPLFPGWTHNNQIILTEDARYYESDGTVLGGIPDCDDSEKYSIGFWLYLGSV